MRDTAPEKKHDLLKPVGFPSRSSDHHSTTTCELLHTPRPIRSLPTTTGQCFLAIEWGVLAVVVVGGAEFAVHHSTISCELLRAPANSCELLTQPNLVCIVDCYLRIGRRRGVGRYFDIDYLRDVIITPRDVQILSHSDLSAYS